MKSVVIPLEIVCHQIVYDVDNTSWLSFTSWFKVRSCHAPAPPSMSIGDSFCIVCMVLQPDDVAAGTGEPGGLADSFADDLFAEHDSAESSSTFSDSSDS